MPMPGVAYPGDNQIPVKEIPIREPGFQTASGKERAAGLCGSDLHVMKWPRSPEAESRIQSHKPCGVIDKLRPGCGFDLRVRDRVLIAHAVSYGKCYSCRRARFELCEVPWRERMMEPG